MQVHPLTVHYYIALLIKDKTIILYFKHLHILQGKEFINLLPIITFSTYFEKVLIRYTLSPLETRLLLKDTGVAK